MFRRNGKSTFSRRENFSVCVKVVEQGSSASHIIANICQDDVYDLFPLTPCKKAVNERIESEN